MPDVALSLKQPWATLLVHGHKTIEVRRWPTRQRGRIYIHAARVPDPRPAAWKHVPDHLKDEATRLVGGLIGEADLTGCVIYRSLAAFCKDQPCHLNEAEWFDGSIFYGFKFANAAVAPFRNYPGWMRFFPVGKTLPARVARRDGASKSP
jgi:hypothetical protein